MAVANSASALAEANAAKTAACNVVVKHYEPKIATVQQMQEYASCVDHLHPAAASGAEVFMVKASIIMAIIGLIVGVWIGLKQDGVVGVLGGVMGFLIGACIPLFIGLIVWGVTFVFTG